jgi:hypothetical protein
MLLILASCATLATLIHLTNGGDAAVVFPVVLIWAITLIAAAPPLQRLKAWLGTPLRWLRAHAALYWLALLALALLLIGVWLKNYQPVWGKAPNAGEIAYLFAAAWGWWGTAAFGASVDDMRAVGAQLSKSRATGVLLTLSTIAVLLVIIELALRMFMIRSDNFAFTAMHYWWNELYWKPINSLGYRDYEPHDDPTQQHILVVGDSFPAGHGINHVDDTFPQVLDQLLEGYTVNIAAQPGWNTNVELEPLNNYPITPNIVILSHYFNDIDYTLTENPVRVTFPEEPLQTIVRDYFTVNFLYWHVFQFGIEGHGGEYVELVLNAYHEPNQWGWHETNLSNFVIWAREHNARLIVIVWPALNALAESAGANTRVAEYFTNFGIEVVNMEEALRGRSTAELVVNPFDAHPNAATHALAAQRLAAVIMNR